MSVWEVCIVALAGFCSGIIKNGVGVGSGIFLLPTLALAFPAKVALGLGAPLMLASDIIGMRYYWKQWAPTPEILRLLLSALPGLIVGTLLLPIIPTKAFRIGVGFFGMFYAVSMLWPHFPPALLLKKMFASISARHVHKQVYIYGSLGGVATVLAHAGGLVWSLYMVSAFKDRRVFVGTLVLMFFITNMYKTCAYLYIGTLSPQALLHILPVIPAVWLGGALGNKANKQMHPELFRKIVLVIIFIVSAGLCL